MLYSIVIALILIADQLLKLWTVKNIELGTEVVSFIPKLFQFRYVRNTGAAFGLFEGQRIPFLIILLIFTVIVILALRKGWINSKFGRWMMILVLGGALGNGIDRLLYGYVVDSIEFIPLIFNRPFPVFNIADCFVVVGGILFCVAVIFYKDELPQPQQTVGRGGAVETKPPKKSAAQKARDRRLAEQNGVPVPPSERKARIVVTPKTETQTVEQTAPRQRPPQAAAPQSAQ
ncbi:signal peptidase II, partial [Clostridiaceae bacterium OttesenSCG-928-D20]|nr:signal peptidase II [Clostridiaceae bacterium OttesenSCG-928-D20]